jgi:mRNA interferase MazF
MPIFDAGQTVRVPFPYADRGTRQRRPALVVSAGGLGEGAALAWVVMITSAENRPWAEDLPLGADQERAGLSDRSVIRPCKIATVESRDIEPLGRIGSELMTQVRDALRRRLEPPAGAFEPGGRPASMATGRGDFGRFAVAADDPP